MAPEYTVVPDLTNPAATGVDIQVFATVGGTVSPVFTPTTGVADIPVANSAFTDNLIIKASLLTPGNGFNSGKIPVYKVVDPGGIYPEPDQTCEENLDPDLEKQPEFGSYFLLIITFTPDPDPT